MKIIPVTPEPQEKAANPELQGVVDKMLKDCMGQYTKFLTTKE